VKFDNLPETDMTDLKALLEAFSSNELSVTMKMEIISNKQYSYIKLSLIDINFPVAQNKSYEPEIYLIDFKNKISYDIKKRQYSKCVSYTLETKKT
jgi:hypothetical protein